MQPYDDSPHYAYSPSSRLTPVVKGLIIAHIAVFAAQFLTAFVFGFSIETYLALHPAALFKGFAIWQLVTYGFLHSPYSLWHIIFNLLALYFFGADVELKFGRKRFLVFYLTAIAAAGLSFCLVNVIKSGLLGPWVVGASGAVFAILVVCAVYWPNRVVIFFIFPMRIRTLVLLFVGIGIFSEVTSARAGVAHMAHLGGALYGYLFVKLGPAFQSLLESSHQHRERREHADRRRDAETLDRILDKVHQKGMHTLSRREKKFLMRESKKRGPGSRL